jgi:hypothetical protein
MIVFVTAPTAPDGSARHDLLFNNVLTSTLRSPKVVSYLTSFRQKKYMHFLGLLYVLHAPPIIYLFSVNIWSWSSSLWLLPHYSWVQMFCQHTVFSHRQCVWDSGSHGVEYAFWTRAPCSFVGVDRRFRGAYCFLHHLITDVMQYALLKRWSTSTRLHITFLKAASLFLPWRDRQGFTLTRNPKAFRFRDFCCICVCSATVSWGGYMVGICSSKGL